MDGAQSNIRIKRRYLFVAILVLGASAAAIGLAVLRTRAERWRCQNQLQAISFALQWYCTGNRGHFPPDLKTLTSTEGVPWFVFHCPAILKDSDHEPSPDYSDYIQIDWDAQSCVTQTQPDKRVSVFDRPEFAEYPLMYDRRLGNHGGSGINIVLVNGQVFWDSHANWLKAFAAKHPSVHIPIPGP